MTDEEKQEMKRLRRENQILRGVIKWFSDWCYQHGKNPMLEHIEWLMEDIK